MKLFTCPACGGVVYFENHRCSCGADLVYDPDGETFRQLAPGGPEACANRRQISCNWLEGPDGLCRACAMTEVIPDLSVQGNERLWAEAEEAKRWVLATLIRFGYFGASGPSPLPRFRLLAEATSAGWEEVVMGHADGILTINVAEADSALREARRIGLGERFRSMTGHFRHELAHFLFTVLAPIQPFLPEFRALFGDERQDYGAALQRHYTGHTAPEASHLTAYAASHPHEDWAETVAHLLHLIDIADSAASAGLVSPALAAAGPGFDAYESRDGARLLTVAAELGIALNHVSRSVGLRDVYPFVISEESREKLAFALDWLHRGASS